MRDYQDTRFEKLYEAGQNALHTLIEMTANPPREPSTVPVFVQDTRDECLRVTFYMTQINLRADELSARATYSVQEDLMAEDAVLRANRFERRAKDSITSATTAVVTAMEGPVAVM